MTSAVVRARGSRPSASPVGALAGRRHDLDGLRGLSIALVVIGHVWFARVSGGVDVFLLLSGFFVGGSLLRRTADGGLRVRGFGLRTAKRMLPVVVVGVIGILVGSALLLPSTRWEDVSWQSIAAVTFTVNWWLAIEGAAYGGADVASSPFQHLWSLSVQVQLYLALAVVLRLVSAAYGTRRRAAAGRAGVAVVGVLAAASFVSAAVMVGVDQAWAYYDTWARAWEFLLGALLAVVAGRAALPGRVGGFAGWIGLAMILATMQVVDGMHEFPGPATLLPLTGAALVILSGPEAVGGPRRLLSWWPVRSSGDHAFGLYVWHWPLLVFALVLAGTPAAGPAVGAAVVVASIIAAVLSRRLVEAPWSTARAGSGVRATSAVLIIAVLVAPAGWLGYSATATATAARSDAVGLADAGAEGRIGALALRGGIQPESEPLPIGEVLAAAQDAPAVYRDGCVADGRDVVRCEYGATDAATTIALVGGSHSGQWFAPLEAIATDHGIRLLTFLRDECYFGANGFDLYLSDECSAWNEAVEAELLEVAPDYVFAPSSRPAGTDLGEWVPEGYIETFSRMTSAGIDVLAIRDTPWLGVNPLDCLATGGVPQACSVERSAIRNEANPAEEVDLSDGVHLLDLEEYICPGDRCLPVIGGIAVYRDDNHLTSGYATSLHPMLEARIGAATGLW